MRSSVFIGSEEVVYEGNINVEFAIDDIKSFNIGNLNRSYTISLPRIPANEKAIKNITLLNSSEQLSETGSIFVGGVKIISGAVKAYSFNDTHVKIYITGDDVVEDIKGKKLTDLDFSALNFSLTAANVSDSWTGDDKFYRFPICTWSRLWSEDAPGTSANWLPNDFVPMFRVKNIFEKIFPGWVIDGSFFSSTRGRNAYVMGVEDIQSDDFLVRKAFNVATDQYSDNYTTKSWTGYSYDSIIFEKAKLEFKTLVSGEGIDNDEEYTIPEDGTYRFTANIVLRNSLDGSGNYTLDESSYILRLEKDGVAIITQTETFYTRTMDGTEVAFDTGWLHFEQGDVITLWAGLEYKATSTVPTETVDIGIEAGSTFVLAMDRRNLYPGIGFTIEPSKYMPSMTQYDFVKAIKEVYNLRFVFDQYNRVIYVHSGNDVLSTNIRDITLDHATDPEGEYIAKNYKKKIVLTFALDGNDNASKGYDSGRIPLPGRKEIELSNATSDSGEEVRTSAFAYTSELYAYSTNQQHRIIAIYGKEEPANSAEPPIKRSNSFMPRLLQWYGMTAGLTFKFNGTAYSNTYPKCATPLFTELYSEFFTSTIRQINIGKLIKLTRLITPDELNEFITEVADESKEGFRSMYRVQIKGEYVLLMLNNIVTDGYKAECEYVIL